MSTRSTRGQSSGSKNVVKQLGKIIAVMHHILKLWGQKGTRDLVWARLDESNKRIQFRARLSAKIESLLPVKLRALALDSTTAASPYTGNETLAGSTVSTRHAARKISGFGISKWREVTNQRRDNGRLGAYPGWSAAAQAALALAPHFPP